MPRISNAELEAFADLRLERDGLRRSLEAALKGEDGMTPIRRVISHPTPAGWRHIALDLAVRFCATQDDANADPPMVVDAAKTFEAYLTGTSDA